MRIRRLARVITAVNPDVAATLRKMTGYSTDAAYKRAPQFTETSGQVQVQELSAEERKLLEGLNLGDVTRKVFLDGAWSSVARQELSGGDQFIFNGFVWGVVRVLEQWAEWTAVAVVQIAPWQPAPPRLP